MWLALVNGAMQMAANSGLLGNNNANPAQSMGQIMQTPVQGPGAIGQYGQPAQLPGPVGQQNAYNQYQQVQGDYDGYSVHEDDLLDDGLGEDPYEDYIDEDGYEYEYEDDEFEYEYEEPDEVERGGRRGNPLDGKSPEEIQAYLNEYIDKNPDKKGQLKQLGMGLATKLLG